MHVHTHGDPMSVDLVERFMGQDSGLLSSLLVVVSGTCFILGTSFLSVLRMRRDNHHALGPACRPDEPLTGSKLRVFCVYN